MSNVILYSLYHSIHYNDVYLLSIFKTSFVSISIFEGVSFDFFNDIYFSKCSNEKAEFKKIYGKCIC